MSLLSFFHWHVQEKVARIIGKIFWPPASASAIVTRDGELLALKLDNYYALPGGTVEVDESFEEAMKREVEEETGCKVEVVERLRESENPAGGREAIFSAEAVEDDQDFSSSWEGDPVWLKLEEAKEKRWRFNRDIPSLLEELD